MEHERLSSRRPDDDVVEARPGRRTVVPATARSPVVQRRLAVGAVDDPYESDADRVADIVIGSLERRNGERPVLLDGRMEDDTRIRRSRGVDVAPRLPRPASSSRRPLSRITASTTGVVQRVASDYKSDVDIKAMTLREFDAYAHSQADWAVSTALGASKEPLRTLLGLARDKSGMVLGGCGEFNVGVLLSTGRYADLTVYARAANPSTWAGTIHVSSPAPDPAEAVEWGKAIRELEDGIGGLIIERVIPQLPTCPALRVLIKAGAVTDLVTYYRAVRPLLDATNGAEVQSYIDFRKEGGQGKYAGYQASLPEIRNYHRFTVHQLDLLAANKTSAATNAASTKLPISVVLQSAFDYNGAFHRDPYMTAVIERTTVITLVCEGKQSLSEFSADLKKFAVFGVGGKVDEVLVSGHGNAKMMELAGDKGVGKNSQNEMIYGEAANERVNVDPTARAATRAKTDAFIDSIKSVLRDDPSARVVLNACLTASNSVVRDLDADPTVAAKQVADAIAADPSLATAMQIKLGAHQGKVLGANASFGQVGLLDTHKRLDIISADDPKLTAPKLEYAEAGTEPLGVLRATLESWAADKAATIDALKRRLVATKDKHNWDETVIRALIRVVAANPDNGDLINKFTRAASPLAHLTSPVQCGVDSIKSVVPTAHVDDVFTELTTADEWKEPRRSYLPLVVHQVWCAHDASRVGVLLGFLDASAFNTRTAKDYLDLPTLNPLLPALLTLPPSTPTPRGAFLIALAHFMNPKRPPPSAAIAYIKGVVGTATTFPATSNVGSVLQGTDEQSVLVAAGVVTKPSAPKTTGAVAPAPANVSPTGAGDNTVAVESVTKKALTYGFGSTDAYLLPAGTKVGSIPSGTRLNVIGITRGTTKALISMFDDKDIRLYAVEYSIGSNKTVFVKTTDVKDA